MRTFGPPVTSAFCALIGYTTRWGAILGRLFENPRDRVRTLFERHVFYLVEVAPDVLIMPKFAGCHRSSVLEAFASGAVSAASRIPGPVFPYGTAEQVRPKRDARCHPRVSGWHRWGERYPRA